MDKENMQEMKMEMVFVSYLVIHKKEFDGPPLRSLMRSWLRPHRGVSQEKLPFYVGFFEWIYNLKKRGKKALNETFYLLLTPDIRKYEDCILSVHC